MATKEKANGKVVVNMTLERTTKTTYRFKEDAPEGEELIGTQYVKQTAFAKEPKKVRVTVEVVE